MTGILGRPSSTHEDAQGDGRDLTGLPVVTLGGDDVAAIGDPVVEDGEVVGHRLQKRSLFGGDLGATLPIADVLAVGADAVIVRDASVLRHDDPEVEVTGTLRVVDLDRAAEDGAAEQPALFSEVRHRCVVAQDTGEPIGRVDRIVVDPSTRTIGSMRLDNVATDVRFLSWNSLIEFGEEAVLVPGITALRKVDGPRERGVRDSFRTTRKVVLTDAGDELGEVDDVEFDRTDGRVTALLVGDQRIDGARLVGVGPHAVVVTA